MGLINTQEPQCSNKKMEIEAGWDRAEQGNWTRRGGDCVADRCGQFFSDSFKKRDSSIVVCTFLISRTVSQDPFQVKKRCLIQSRAGKVDIGWGRGWRIDLATGPGWTRGSRPLSSLGDQDLPTATPLSTSLQLETATICKPKSLNQAGLKSF